MDNMGDIGKEINQDYEAIALALDALGYMLRKTHHTALMMHVSMVAQPQMPQINEYCLNRVCSDCRGQLRFVRKELAKLLEAVGEDRNAWDAVTETESKLTTPAFEAMKDQFGVDSRGGEVANG